MCTTNIRYFAFIFHEKCLAMISEISHIRKGIGPNIASDMRGSTVSLSADQLSTLMLFIVYNTKGTMTCRLLQIMFLGKFAD